jgi:hypothetical protein
LRPRDAHPTATIAPDRMPLHPMAPTAAAWVKAQIRERWCGSRASWNKRKEGRRFSIKVSDFSCRLHFCFYEKKRKITPVYHTGMNVSPLSRCLT